MNKIETFNLTKKFGDFIANDNINISIKEGEITAIVGENGAGKTTLMNMLYGLLQPTSGKIHINGKSVNFKSPIDAIEHGIGMVHQHFKLVPSLTVFENIMLGIEIKKKVKIGKEFKLNSFIIDKKKEKEEVQKIIDLYKFDLNPDDKVENISIGAKQRIEILKMLYRNVDILIFDEPTAVLTPQEVDEILESFRELKKQGKTIILITHKLREVMDVSDNVIVIKRGKVLGGKKTKDTSSEELASLMVGREVLVNVNKDRAKKEGASVVYELRNISTEPQPGKKCLDGISFKIHEGEILGIAGVEGNGQSELVKVITGLMESSEGEIYINGKDITNKWPKEIRKSGVGIIPEDRYAQGLCRDMKLSENIIAGYHDREEYSRHGFMKFNKIKEKTNNLIHKYDIRVADKDGNVSQLSGGNAQKVIIAREFESDPSLLIASQPTRGVDIGSIEFIHNRILKFRKRNKAILLVSSELSEIMNLSDRIAVMYKGKIIDIVNAEETTASELGLLMAGIGKNKELCKGDEDEVNRK
ncbi:ABC transporter ATP-binding protein [Proteiniborus sp. MB09-C3]|uniref:ABC transporter ATP-binding protein n=1 Tax=Proteiniborus sp. MB09-C3 TaxID=3050072 RepID=UPI002552DA2F|nr:ABC transporter ATP-binding protein [Proteiniborus sp. MB09-C3]WIV11626.1 ABC transporter ATP-binding protein [Proteiniborus sp. MB09-C3]